LTQAPARTTDSAPTALPSQTIAPGSTTLREYRAGAHVYLAENHGGAGDLGPGLVSEKLVEAHRGLTVSWLATGGHH
jgi:hypothetical protein